VRKYPDGLADDVRRLVDSLALIKEIADYRKTMTLLGQELARAVLPKLPTREGLVLICSNEDADFLARGFVDRLNEAHCQIALACFWNDRVRLGWMEDRAPIVKRYIEPITKASAFLVIKSIIFSSCVVRTNISELVYQLNPDKVIVLAPVVLEGVQERLNGEFPSEISRRFEYLWLAEDDQTKEDGEVIPGIGGSVYELLGLGTEKEKNRFVPDLVKERRQALRA